MRRTVLGKNKAGYNQVLLSDTSGLVAPSKQCSYIAFSNVIANSLKASCAVGTGGTGRIAVVRLNNDWTETDAFITTLRSLYNLSNNGNHTSGIVIPTPIAGGYSTICWSMVGSSSSLNRTAYIYNLLPSTTYYFKFYEFNHNSVGIIYLSDNATSNPRSKATL